MSGVFIDRFGKDITFRPVDEKHSEMNVDVYVSPQFFGWIFSLGKDVKVTGPDEVVDAMKKFAGEFMKNYQQHIGDFIRAVDAENLCWLPVFFRVMNRKMQGEIGKKSWCF